MATAKLKSGEIIQKPLEELLEFVVDNPDALGQLESSKPLPQRRTLPKEEVASNRE